MTGQEYIQQDARVEDIAESDVGELCERCGESLPYGWSDDGLCENCQQWEEYATSL